jgi:hypothetical protein
MEPQFKLGQEIAVLFAGIIVPSKITNRIKVENLDTGEVEIYYDYKHLFLGGSDFERIPESSLIENYQEAIKEYMEINDM